MKIERFEDLLAWQEARKLTRTIYSQTSRDEFRTDRELIRQMRAAATSVMANTAEGFSRYSLKDSKQFFIMARSSLEELRSHAYIAEDQRYMTSAEAVALRAHMATVGKLLTGLIRNSRVQMLKEPLSHSAIEPLNAFKR